MQTCVTLLGELDDLDMIEGRLDHMSVLYCLVRGGHAMELEPQSLGLAMTDS
jgi:hypothetical protein